MVIAGCTKNFTYYVLPQPPQPKTATDYAKDLISMGCQVVGTGANVILTKYQIDKLKPSDDKHYERILNWHTVPDPIKLEVKNVRSFTQNVAQQQIPHNIG
jgi:hypothetical protein